jgi:hypothetical protein
MRIRSGEPLLLTVGPTGSSIFVRLAIVKCTCTRIYFSQGYCTFCSTEERDAADLDLFHSHMGPNALGCIDVARRVRER